MWPPPGGQYARTAHSDDQAWAVGRHPSSLQDRGIPRQTTPTPQAPHLAPSTVHRRGPLQWSPHPHTCFDGRVAQLWRLPIDGLVGADGQPLEHHLLEAAIRGGACMSVHVRAFNCVCRNVLVCEAQAK